MEEGFIKISQLNDFIFCPLSIYFHSLIYGIDKMLYASQKQMQGSAIHQKVDKSEYSTSKDVITSLEVYSEKFALAGKIDIYDKKHKMLIERKRHITKVYDGQFYQLYAQYLCLQEMGYEVEKLRIYSYDDNKSYDYEIGKIQEELVNGFYATLDDMRNFDIKKFVQKNKEKCAKCVYNDMCDRCCNDRERNI